MPKIDSINKRYMQSADFWQDKHNKKAAEIIDKLMVQRDILSTIPQNNPKDFFQKTDGFVLPKPKQGSFQFLHNSRHCEQEFAKSINNKYALLKSDLSKLSKSIKSNIKQEKNTLNTEV